MAGPDDAAPGRPGRQCPARLPPRTAAFGRGLREAPEPLTKAGKGALGLLQPSYRPPRRNPPAALP